MANGMGVYIQLPAEPGVYISGDTVYTPEVDRALVELKPDIAVVAAGNARLDAGHSILMSMDELIHFTKAAPKWVVANHLEALNHCPITRLQLQRILEQENLLHKVSIPADGEVLNF